MTGKTKDKIEPSKVVVLPDVAIRGTDYTNMQIKELKSQKSHGIWLAVHIPDNATTLRPVKILSTKKAAEDLEKVIGPNRETMFKELQTIIGVDGPTLRQMLKSGQIDGRRNKKKHKDEDGEKEEEEEEEEEEDEDNSNGESDDDEEDDDEEEKEEKEGNSGEDDKCEDDDDKEEEEGEDVEEEEDEDEEDEEDNKNQRKHNNKLKNLKKFKSQMDKTRGKSEKNPNPRKKCSRQNLLPWTINDGGSGAEKNESTVFQPQGYKVPLAKLFNKIHVRLKRKKACKHATNPIIKELCKQMNRHHRRPRPNFNQPRRHLRLAHNKYYKHLKRLMRKFLDNHNGKQAQQVLQYMNLLLSDQLRLSPDGIVHLFPNRLGKPNNYGDGFKALADDESASKGQGSPPLEPPIMDDSMYNEHVIRVPEPASTRGTTAPNFGIVSNSQANVLNNQVHTKLGDARSEADMQMQMLKEELGKSNDELREQQKEKERDEAIMDKYMFNFQSLAEKGPMSTLDGMQKDAERRVNGQQVSVIDPNQISLKQSRLPIRNRLDVPSLGGYVGGQFTGFVRRNKIENHLKSFAKRIREHQRQQKGTQSRKSGKGPRSINKTRPAKRAL